MMDWDQDPELKALRAEFVASFPERVRELEAAVSGPVQAETIQLQAHKIAGIAATYGFPTLTRIGELIDDYLDAGGSDGLAEYAALVRDALDMAVRNSEDPRELMLDPRMEKLICAAESLPSGSRP